MVQSRCLKTSLSCWSIFPIQRVLFKPLGVFLSRGSLFSHPHIVSVLILSSHALPTNRFQVLFSITITSFFNNALPTKRFLTEQCTKVKSDSVPDDLFEFQNAQTSNRTDLMCLTLSSFEFHPQKDRNFKNKKKTCILMS